jgi:hypothetical protein
VTSIGKVSGIDNLRKFQSSIQNILRSKKLEAIIIMSLLIKCLGHFVLAFLSFFSTS